MEQLQPRDLVVNRQEKTLVIQWSDGHSSAYPLAGLRNVCPCAECRGGHEAMAAPVARSALHQQTAATWELRDAHLVGHYALGFVWADGHDAGIYTWGFLRALCPCDQCDAEAASAGDSNAFSA